MPASEEFSPTRWSLVAAASGNDPAAAKKALERLCSDYWRPLYGFVRRRGFSAEDAEDIVQSFFEHLLEREYFASASQEKGRLRSYLIGSLQRFIAGHLRRERALKRGGTAIFIHMDDASAGYVEHAVETMTPETLYHRQWALTVLERAVTTLAERFASKQQTQAFDLLKPALTVPTAEALDTAAVAETLGIPRDQIKMRVHRMRTEFRDILLSQITDTLQSTRRSDAEAELRQLLEALT